MGKKVLATIMDRHYLGDGFFLFSVNHAAVGEVNDETKLFRDRNGNEYAPMLNSWLMSSEIPYAYNNILPLSEVQTSVGPDLTLAEAIGEYEYLCKKVLYFVGKTETGEIFFTMLNTESIKEAAEAAKAGEDDFSSEETEEQDMDTSVKQLIEDVVNGKYSLEQLRGIVKNLNQNKEDLEQAIDTIELQIEASEKGESFTKLAKEKEIEDSQPFQVSTPKPTVDINDLFQKVTRTLIAQDEPARRVIVEIARKEMDERKKKEGILLTGATGVGKTELMRLIAKYLNKPFHKIDSTQLTIPGYVGKDIEQELWDLYLECGRDIKKAEQAIIFFDEIDKKGSSKKSDVSGQGVLNILLPFIEGATYVASEDSKTPKEKVKIRTNNMTVILGGAYTDVYRNLIEKNGVGFGSEISSNSSPKYRKATTKDFIEYGMMTDEFMGRVTVIKLNDLDVDAIKRIILESDQSAMRIQKEIFEKLGVRLTFTDGYTNEIAKGAVQKKAGARGLNSIIDETTWRAFDEVHCNPGEYEEVILDEESVQDPTHYQLVKKRKESN